MKKMFTSTLKVLSLIWVLLLSALNNDLFAQTITENFDNTTTWVSVTAFSTSTVQIGTSTQSTWIYSGARPQTTTFNSSTQSFNITNSGNAYLISPIITGGFSTLSFTYRNSSNNAAIGVAFATNITFVTGSATAARSSTLTTGASPWFSTVQFTNATSANWSTWTYDATALGANSTKDMYIKFFRVGGAIFLDDINITLNCSPPNVTGLSASAATICAKNPATVTVSSSNLASGSYTVTYDVSGTNTLSSRTATMNFTAGSPGTGTFLTDTLVSAGAANVVNITKIASSVSCFSNTTTSTAAFTTDVIPTAAAISGSSYICSIGGTTTLTTTDVGGTWGTSNASIATVSSGGVVTAVANGTCNITYTTAANGFGCSDVAYKTMNIGGVSITPTTPLTVSLGPGAMSPTPPALAFTTSGSPDQYIIDYSDAGFTDISSYTSLGSSPLSLTVPTNITTPTTFNGNTITVKNSTSGCTSSATSFSLVFGTSSTDYFRSKSSGNWSDAANWQSSGDGSNWYDATAAPTTTSKGVTVRNGHVITVDANLSAPPITINSGGELTTSASTITPSGSNTITVDGRLSVTANTKLLITTTSNLSFGSTGVFYLNANGGYMPNAAWNATSTAYITGWTTAYSFTADNGTFPATATNRVGSPASQWGNLVFDFPAFNPSSTARILAGFANNAAITIGGNLTLLRTNSLNTQLFTSSGATGLTCESLTINCGTWKFNNASYNVTVNKDFRMVDSLSATGGYSVAALDFGTSATDNLNVKGNFVQSIGTITSNAGSQSINFTGTSAQSATFNTLVNAVHLNINNSAGVTVTSGSANLTMEGSITLTSGVFDLNGKTLTLSNNTSFQPIIRTAGTLTVGSAGSLVFGIAGKISGVDVVIPNGTFTTSNPAITNLTLYRDDVLTWGDQGVEVTGTLTLTQGTFNIGSGLLNLNGAALSAPAGYLSGSSTSDFTLTGTPGSGASINMPIASTISLRTVTIGGNRTLVMPGTTGVNLDLYGTMTIGYTNSTTYGTYDNNGESQITNNGSAALVINGRFITRDAQGFWGTNSSVPTVPLTINTNSTVEYGRAGTQDVQGGLGGAVYYNLLISNSGTKTVLASNTIPPGGTITITGSAVLDVANFSLGATGTAVNVTMTGTSKMIVAGTSTRPVQAGTYTLATTSTIEFNNTTVGNVTAIRTTGVTYANVIISGTYVANISVAASAGITLQSGCSFTVKTGAIFKVSKPDGFSGNVNSAVSSTNNPTIVLETGSIIDYYGGGNTATGSSSVAVISNAIPYQGIRLSSTGTVTAPAGTVTVNGSWSNTGSTFAHGNGTVLFTSSTASHTFTQSGGSGTFYNLTLDNTFTGGKLTYMNNMTVDGQLTLTSGELVNNSNYTLTLNGTIANSGTGTITGSTTANIYIGGSSGGALGIMKFTSGARMVSNFTLNRTGGSGASATMGTDLNIQGNFIATAGAMEINGNTLRFYNGIWTGATLTGSNTSSLIVANIGGNMSCTNSHTTLKSLSLTTGATLTLVDSLDITAWSGSVVGDVTLASGATLTTGDKLTLKSTVNGTARVGVSYGSFSGKAIAERYMQIGTVATSRRWHLLCTPFIDNGNAQTIKQAWQENSSNTDRNSPINPNPGYGTQITKSTTAANGFDQGSTNNPSIYHMIPGGQLGSIQYSTITTTDTVITGREAYMIFVRGDRSIIVSSQYIDAGPTTLRAKGNLYVGDKTKTLQPYINVLGNPYASAISVDSLTFHGVKFVASGYNMYIFDPKVAGSLPSPVGRFVTLSSEADSTYTFSGNVSNFLDVAHDSVPFIESGMGFAVYSQSAPHSFGFHETDKISISSNTGLASRPVAGAAKKPSKVKTVEKLFTDLYAVLNNGTYSLADGVANTFHQSYSNEVDEKDALKLSSFNLREGLGILSGGKELSIEKRKKVLPNDTIFLQTRMMQDQAYQFKFRAQNFNPGLNAYLQDTYTGTITQIDISGSNASAYDFTINNSIPASANVNRFRIIFKNDQGGPLPVTFNTVKATPENKNIAVEWKVENELNIKNYEVQRAADGVNFSTVATVTADGSAGYNWLDVNPFSVTNYYRIRSINQNGEVLYSRIVKVTTGKTSPAITAYPNIIENGVTGLQLNNMPKGKYDVRMINSTGQVVLVKQINYAGGTSVETLKIDNASVKGMYQLEITKPDRTKTVLKVLNQ
ncbi:beta strand repeat-containing protein [Ferruginibacter sp. SUN002]|uniref:beta strand repeat-containing protein n=1 Tax=Ferruginibacter sp. SUN002 TaxID=2937789 RepID=UPI003D367D11